MASYKTKQTLEDARKIADYLKGMMLTHGFKEVAIVGSIRRCEPMVGDIDIVADGDLLSLQHLPGVDWKRGGEESATFVYQGQQVNVIRADRESWGAAIFYLTGPAQYQVAYRARAKRMGLRLNQNGLFDQHNARIAGRTEESIYEALDKEWKSPELRGKK